MNRPHHQHHPLAVSVQNGSAAASRRLRCKRSGGGGMVAPMMMMSDSKQMASVLQAGSTGTSSSPTVLTNKQQRQEPNAFRKGNDEEGGYRHHHDDDDNKCNDDEVTTAPTEESFSRSSSLSSSDGGTDEKNDSINNGFDVKRQMTPLQERWNALTAIPPTFYCLAYLFSLAWIPMDLIAQAQQQLDEQAATTTPVASHEPTTTTTAGSELLPELALPFALRGRAEPFVAAAAWQGECGWSWMPAVPPAPLLAVVVGTALHMPCSVLYHGWFAASKRLQRDAVAHAQHWSKRLDQAAIHVASALLSYGTSGSVAYFTLCTLFNLYFVYRHWTLRPCCCGGGRPRRAAPKPCHHQQQPDDDEEPPGLDTPPPASQTSGMLSSQQIRLGLVTAIALYSLPLLWPRQRTRAFVLFWLVMSLSFWLFARYPLHGWSHVAFHVVVGFVPLGVLVLTPHVPASQPQLLHAAQCLVRLRQPPDQVHHQDPTRLYVQGLLAETFEASE